MRSSNSGTNSGRKPSGCRPLHVCFLPPQRFAPDNSQPTLTVPPVPPLRPSLLRALYGLPIESRPAAGEDVTP